MVLMDLNIIYVILIFYKFLDLLKIQGYSIV